MSWTYNQWLDHLRAKHGYDAKFEYMLPGTVGGCAIRHDLDHDDEIGLGHAHTDSEDLDEMEEV